jgi:hypothetical protein
MLDCRAASARLLFAALAALASVLIGSEASAQVQPVRIRYEAHEGCPSAAAFVEEIASRTSRMREAQEGDESPLLATIAADKQSMMAVQQVFDRAKRDAAPLAPAYSSSNTPPTTCGASPAAACCWPPTRIARSGRSGPMRSSCLASRRDTGPSEVTYEEQRRAVAVKMVVLRSTLSTCCV